MKSTGHQMSSRTYVQRIEDTGFISTGSKHPQGKPTCFCDDTGITTDEHIKIMSLLKNARYLGYMEVKAHPVGIGGDVYISWIYHQRVVKHWIDEYNT
jgi:hypothetical protein